LRTRSEWLIQKSEVVSDDGIVCAHHLAAAEAGADMLARGGNAIDAAVAAGFAVGVAEPYNSGAGGIAQLLHRDAATGKVTVFDGTSVLPHRIRPDVFRIADPPATAGMYGWPAVEGDLNNTGWLAPAVPGTPACLLAAHERFGRLSRSDVMAPAIRLADDGVEVDWNISLSIVTSADRIAQFAATREIYFRLSGMPLTPESFSSAPDRLYQHDLAATLARISDEGPEVLYRGEIAKQIARQMAEHGGLIDEEDLAAYRVRVFDAGVTVNYRGYDVTVAPEVGGGLTIAQALRILDGLDLRQSGFGSTRALHLMIESQRRAFADRFRYLGDPSLVAVPYRGLFSDAYASERRATINLTQATPEQGAGNPWAYQGAASEAPAAATTVPPDHGHTTHLTVVDRDRNMVSLTSTLGAVFGCGVVVPGTGLLLNNGTTWFDPRPGSQNSIAPGRRILWAGSPALVARNGRPVAAVGAPGGRKVISAVLQVIVNLLEFRLGMQDAVSAPRVHCEGRPVFADARFPIETIEGLRALGHDVSLQAETMASSFFGRPNGVLIDEVTGRLRGGINQFKPYFAVGL
jgi:gamma-glutamyltranspeptidase/glutathione hydrolase